MRQESYPAGENKMGVMPVNRLLITMALPIDVYKRQLLVSTVFMRKSVDRL